MKKKHHALTEHYLVPAVLFSLNICLVHVIYAFVGSSYSLTGKMAVALAFMLLAGSLFLKWRIVLAGSILFYTLVVFMV